VGAADEVIEEETAGEVFEEEIAEELFIVDLEDEDNGDVPEGVADRKLLEVIAGKF